MPYDFRSIEARWRDIWDKRGSFEPQEGDAGGKKFYCLEMFPYPSGALHMGHLRNYSIGDLAARCLKMDGYSVMHPIGFDSFGMPAENAAIKHKTHPADWTLRNIDQMTEQLRAMGCSYDWRRMVKTCLPEYYRWSQWFFLKMYEAGIAYRKHAPVNWCGTCGTVLANEQVSADGTCWRCGGKVTKRDLDQWFLRITDYAGELESCLDDLTGWPERVRTMQRNWIGRSDGVRLKMRIDGTNIDLEVFTTRADTLFGVSFVVVAPEHPVVAELARIAGEERSAAIDAFVSAVSERSAIERTAEGAEKHGVDTGLKVEVPGTCRLVPLWIADYVLTDYGTGAVMGVPAHDQRDFEFAKKYGFDIIPVVREDGADAPDPAKMTASAPAYGVSCGSGEFDGLPTKDAIQKIADWLEGRGIGKRETQYRLRDWLISRQRYWGTPIPVVKCEHCGYVPVPESDLPIELPMDAVIPENGGNALDACEDWIRTTCPRCGRPARRETDTMDTFICSSWYFLRYLSLDCHDAPFKREDVSRWMPVDLYIGGIEHACLHLIYARFFTKILADLGIIDKDLREPFRGLLTQGMVIKDGAKMSKSLGNVVDPDEIISRYGADTARLFILFAAPPEKSLDWSDRGVEGAHRFLNRVYRFVEEGADELRKTPQEPVPTAALGDSGKKELKRLIHTTLDRVTRDIKEERQFNTAVARLMELNNGLAQYPARDAADRALIREGVEILLKCLYPYCPHICEELWDMIGGTPILAESRWPQLDVTALTRDTVPVVLQINGKVREQYEMEAGLDKDELARRVMDEERTKARIDGREIVRVVAVPNKLVNVVVRG